MRTARTEILLLAFVFCTACAGSSGARLDNGEEPGSGAESSRKGMVVTISAEQTSFTTGRDAMVRTKIENRGDQPMQLNVYGASSAILFLQVYDRRGDELHTIPPPVPPEEMEYVTLAPGESREFGHSLNMFSPPLSKGRYSVRVRSKNAESNQLEFRILSTVE